MFPHQPCLRVKVTYDVKCPRNNDRNEVCYVSKQLRFVGQISVRVSIAMRTGYMIVMVPTITNMNDISVFLIQIYELEITEISNSQGYTDIYIYNSDICIRNTDISISNRDICISNRDINIKIEISVLEIEIYVLPLN